MQPSVTEELTEADCFAQIGTHQPETLLPGYWNSIASNCQQWASEVSTSPYWAEATTLLSQWRTEFRATCNSDLLNATALPSFVGKSEESIRDKILRRCKLDRKFISQAVTAAPPVPTIKDLVRTRLVCTYIDGVEFLTTKLMELADKHGILVERSREGRLEGYFAQHLNISQSVIFRMGGIDRLARVTCEIQVASEMATRMWDVGHLLYERVRGTASVPANWQWSPTDPRFIPHQLGHMIHLADGLLVQIRDAAYKKV